MINKQNRTYAEVGQKNKGKADMLHWLRLFGRGLFCLMYRVCTCVCTCSHGPLAIWSVSVAKHMSRNRVGYPAIN